MPKMEVYLHKRSSYQNEEALKADSFRRRASQEMCSAGICLLVLLWVQFFSCAGRAQELGIPLFSTQTGSQFDSFNLASGAIRFHLPIRSKSGPIPIAIQYSGGSDLTWHHNWNNGKTYWLPAGFYDGAKVAQNKVVANDFGAMAEIIYLGDQTTCWDPPYINGFPVQDPIYISNMTIAGVYDSDGALHPIANSGLGLEYLLNNCTGMTNLTPGSTYQTTDGSGYTVYVLGPGNYFDVIDRSGNQGEPFSYGAKFNSNGLAVGFSTSNGTEGAIIDTFNEHIMDFALLPTGRDFSYNDGSGTPQSITFQDSPYTFQTNFGCPFSPYNDSSDLSPTAAGALTRINLPGGRAYTFGYEPTPGYPGNITGRLAHIGLPTGGSISYSYSGEHNGVYCQSESGNRGWPSYIDGSALAPTVTRTVNDGNGHSSTWTYSFSNPNSQTTFDLSTTTVTDPSNNVTIYQFKNSYQTEELVYQGSASAENLLKTTITCYLGNFTTCANPPLVGTPYLGGGVYVNQTDVFTAYNNSSSYSLTETIFNTYGLPTEVKEYDYGVVALGSAPTGSNVPIKRTVTSYGSWDGSSLSCIKVNTYLSGVSSINDRPCEVQVYSAGTLVSVTRNKYDPNGNLLTTSSKVNSSDWISQSYTYAANGAMLTSTDGNGYTTTYSDFDCNGLLPQTITKNDGTKTLTWGQSWDCNAGKKIADKGPWIGSDAPSNSPTNSYSYEDPYFRPTKTQYSDGGEADICYSDGGGTGCDKSTTVNKKAATTKIDESHSTSSIVTSDGLGRPLVISMPNGAYTANGYDLLGHVCATSNPSATAPPATGLSCTPTANSAGSNSTDGYTYYAYDALGRATSVTKQDGQTQGWSYNQNIVTFTDENQNQWKRTSNVLGSLTKVLEPSGSTKTPSLETDYTYDALGNLWSVTQIGKSGDTARTRTFTYDNLSRLLTSANPEIGTVCYGVWQNNNCVNGYDNNGNLLVKTDARGVQTHYAYDHLNRLLNKRYTKSDGTSVDEARTPISCFQYDTTSITGASTAGNFVGRLTNSWTQPAGTSCGSAPPVAGSYLTLKSVLAYDSMGRPKSEQQCTPSKCSQSSSYATSYDYNLAGNLTALTNGSVVIPGGTTPLKLTYNYNAAGQMFNLQSNWQDATHPSPLFNASSFLPHGTWQNAIYGSGLNLTRSYDNRLRITGEADTSTSSPAMPGTATITITGSEQSQ